VYLTCVKSKKNCKTLGPGLLAVKIKKERKIFTRIKLIFQNKAAARAGNRGAIPA
jgi:hypothetical protein